MENGTARRRLPAFNRAGMGHWIRGVFEGGGAKGIAYRGALEAVDQLDCWFEAVAGASAGAITAGLIASGHGPEDLDNPTDELLGLLRFDGLGSAARSLRKKGEIFPRTEFRDKLDRFFREKLKDLGLRLELDEPVTFKTMCDFTGIDLFVCAADVTRREPMVFSREFTPGCQVADAVVASSSIPFAFDGGMLTSGNSTQQAEGPKGSTINVRSFRTVVDGGVWTNFPMFVFRDPTFATYMREVLGLEARNEPNGVPGPVVGFLLHELLGDDVEGDEEKRREELAKAYRAAQFVDGPEGEEKLVPIERAKELQQEAVPAAARVMSKLLGSWNKVATLKSPKFHGTEVRRSPAPQKEMHRKAVDALDGALGWMHNTRVALFSVLVFLLIEAGLLALLVERMSSPIVAGWSEFRDVGGDFIDFAVPVGVALLLFGLYLQQLRSFGIMFLGPVVLNWTLLLPARRMLIGLVGTLVATPGTTPWEHRDPNVIPLPIPTTLKTLSQKDEVEGCREQVVGWARDETTKRLPGILRRA